MPRDTWGHAPTVTPHGYGFSIPLAVTERTVPADDETPAYTCWDGIRVEVRSLTSVDITAGLHADPDAGDEHLTEALTLALDATAPSVQAQIDDLTNALLGGI